MQAKLREVAKNLHAAAVNPSHYNEDAIAEVLADADDAFSELLAIAEASEGLRAACTGLLAFIRERYPQDFVEGGRGYVCPHHIAIDAALSGAVTTGEGANGR